MNIDFANDLAWALKRASVSRVIALGSQAEYLPAKDPWTDESPVRATDPYSHAKLEVRRSLDIVGTSMCWVRLFSVYGEGDNSDWLMPQLMRAITRDGVIELGPCNNDWTFTHIHDVCNALSSIIRLGVTGSVVLTDPSYDRLKVLVSYVWKSLGSKGRIEFKNRGEMGRDLRGMPEKLLKAGWKPQVSLKNGVTAYEAGLRNCGKKA